MLTVALTGVSNENTTTSCDPALRVVHCNDVLHGCTVFHCNDVLPS